MVRAPLVAADYLQIRPVDTTNTSATTVGLIQPVQRLSSAAIVNNTSNWIERRHNPLPSSDWADRSRMNVHSTVPNSHVSVSKVFRWCLQHSDQSRGPVKLEQPSRPKRAETQDLQKRTNAQDAKRNLNTKRHRRGTNERYDRTTANLIQTKTKNSTAMNQASRSTTTTQEHWHYKHNPFIWEFVSIISTFVSKLVYFWVLFCINPIISNKTVICITL